jgi:hypothetical protein
MAWNVHHTPQNIIRLATRLPNALVSFILPLSLIMLLVSFGWATFHQYSYSRYAILPKFQIKKKRQLKTGFHILAVKDVNIQLICCFKFSMPRFMTLEVLSSLNIRSNRIGHQLIDWDIFSTVKAGESSFRTKTSQVIKQVLFSRHGDQSFELSRTEKGRSICH